VAVDLHRILSELRRCRWVDLTHSFSPDIPHCPSFEREHRTTLYHYDEGVGMLGSGFLAHEYRLAGQWGTHVDPPAHFVRGLRFQDEIPVTEMILPLVVLDVHEQVQRNADYCVSLDDVRAWESHHGPIPAESFVALRTDWSRRWPYQELMLNRDSEGIAHFPGWSREVLDYLYVTRGITASGHDTTDTDGGMVVSRREAPLEAFVLGQNKWQIELLTNLDQVPVHGALAVASWPKPKHGSGFPARVFAICPELRETTGGGVTQGAGGRRSIRTR
jgi:kynurenine formamidase